MDGIKSYNFIDLTGKKFNKLTVVSIHHISERRRVYWNCLCDCGKKTIVQTSNLKNGGTKSCGCSRNKPNAKLIDLLGNKFGKLTVIERSKNGKHGQTRWKCLCDCGNTSVVDAESLRTGHTKSCGCEENAYDNLADIRFGKLLVIKLDHINKCGIYWICECDCGKIKIVSSKNLHSGRSNSCGCSRVEFLIGQRFGRLTVIERASDYISEKGRHEIVWKCQCDCGNIKDIRARSLKNKGTQSCGCLAFEQRNSLKIENRFEANINKILGNYKRGASNRDLEFCLMKDDFSRMILEPCYYCGTEKSNSQTLADKTVFGYNGIDRIDSSLGYIYGNVVPCCKNCNLAKRDLPQGEFLLWLEKAYNHSIRDKVSA